MIKQRIEAPTRTLTARWTLEPTDFGDVRKKPETEEEEAEEIIHRLKSPPKPRDTLHDIINELSAQIAIEIDKEILTYYAQRSNRTR